MLTEIQYAALRMQPNAHPIAHPNAQLIPYPNAQQDAHLNAQPLPVALVDVVTTRCYWWAMTDRIRSFYSKILGAQRTRMPGLHTITSRTMQTVAWSL